MKIGVDIDGVLTDIEKFICDYGTKFCYENNIPINIKNIYYDEAKMFNWNKEQDIKFWNTYLELYVKEGKLRDFAVEVISKLKEKNEIHIITARNDYGLPTEDNDKMPTFTKKWLEDNNIDYNKLVFCSDAEKIDYCIENKIDIMIEDSPVNIKNMSKYMKVMCYNCLYNEGVEGENITRVYGWYDILSKIEKI
jgi:uncharacterized HAD superfamily protein